MRKSESAIRILVDKLSVSTPDIEHNQLDTPAKVEKSETTLEDVAVESGLIANKSAEQAIPLRKQYANNVWWFMVWWFVFIGTLLILQGFKPWNFSLSDNVLMVLLGTTTINLLALVNVIVKNLFPRTDIK